MKKFIKLFIACAFLVSCGDFEEVIYDGVNGQTLAFFKDKTSTLEVEINSTNTTTIKIGVSTLSSSDRTVTVSADPASTAVAAMYSFSSTVTIPANEYFGELTITGIDEGLTTDSKTLILNIEDSNGINAGSESHTITLVEICPIAPTFAVGMYTATFVSGGIAASGMAPVFGNGDTIELQVGSSSTERIFNLKLYPTVGLSNPPADFSFSLVCATTVTNGIVAGQDSGVVCSNNLIQFGPAPTPGTYTVGDDTTITLVFKEDSTESCGTAGITRYTLTKI